MDEKGKVLNSRGSGGTYIIVKEVERITVLGADGIPLFFWSQAGALPAINQLLLLN